MGWLSTLSAMGHRRKIRAIGLDHVTIGRNFGSALAHLLRILEGDDAGEGDQMTESGQLGGLFRSASKAVENTADFPGVVTEHVEGVNPGGALMDHHIKSQLHSKIELHSEGIGLSSLPGSLGDQALLIP